VANGISAGFSSRAGTPPIAGFDTDGAVETVGGGATAVLVIVVLGSGDAAAAGWRPDAGGV